MVLAEERSGATRDLAGEERRPSAAKLEPKPIDFVEIVQAPSDQRFELVAASGWTVRVPAQFDGAALRRLLAALEGV